MTDKELDEKLRDLCLGYTEIQTPDVWDGIEKKLARKRRFVLWRRVGISAAAAAVIAVGFIATRDVDSAALYQYVSVEGPEVAELMDAAENGDVMVEETAVKTVLPVRALSDVLNGGSDSDSKAGAEMKGVILSDENAVNDEKESVAEESLPSQRREIVSVAGYETSDYMAFAEENSVKGGRLALSASSDFYTIYGSGNVSFAGKSMSGGSSGSGLPDIKPLAGSSPSHSLPLSAGLTVQYGFGPVNSFGQHRFGVGVGVNYTCLRSTYDALVCKEYLGKYGSGSEQASVSQNVHYLGVPLSFYANILTTDKLFFYASAGGEVEKGIQLKYKFTDQNGVTSDKTMAVSGVQWSVNLGLGFEYKFVKFMGVYVDPRLTYYFDCNQPYSLREEQRLQMNLGLGFRFHF